jgi:hypothetical protein
MLLCGDVDLIRPGYRGLEAGTYRIDSQLLQDAYATCPQDLRLELAHSLAFIRSEPTVFRRLFLDLWKTEATPSVREELAGILHTFLIWNPARADDYRDIILELFWSPRRYTALPALHMLGYLSDLSPRDLERIKARVTGKWFDHRMNGLNGLCNLVKRHREVSPDVVAFATSPELRAIARRIQRTDPDKDARTCAYYLLKAIREYDARGPKTRRRRRRGASK